MMTPDELKKIREKLGMTQRDFADRLGVIVTTISPWQMGVQ